MYKPCLHVDRNWKGICLQWKYILSLDVTFIIKRAVQYRVSVLTQFCFSFSRTWFISMAFSSFSLVLIYILFPVLDEFTPCLWLSYLWSALALKILAEAPQHSFSLLVLKLSGLLLVCLFNALIQLCVSGSQPLYSLQPPFFLYSVLFLCSSFVPYLHNSCPSSYDDHIHCHSFWPISAPFSLFLACGITAP